MNKELLVLSDIHGRGDELEVLIKKLYNRLDRYKIVLLGDYIGYGKSNLKVIKIIKYLKEHCDTVVLKGNWEDMFYCYVKKNSNSSDFDKSKVAMFSQRGGVKAANELFTDKKLLSYYLEMIEQMPLFHIEKQNPTDIFFSHSGINFHKLDKDNIDFHTLISKQTDIDLIWNFDYYNTVLSCPAIAKIIPYKIVSGHVPTCIIKQDNKNDCFILHDKIIGVDFGASRKSGKLGVTNLTQDGYKTIFQNIL